MNPVKSNERFEALPACEGMLSTWHGGIVMYDLATVGPRMHGSLHLEHCLAMFAGFLVRHVPTVH